VGRVNNLELHADPIFRLYIYIYFFLRTMGQKEYGVVPHIGQWTGKDLKGNNTVKPLSIVPGSVVQFLWSLSESYFNYGSCIYCFPGSIVSFSDPPHENDE
jgi:hypothetical protein